MKQTEQQTANIFKVTSQLGTEHNKHSFSSSSSSQCLLGKELYLCKSLFVCFFFYLGACFQLSSDETDSNSTENRHFICDNSDTEGGRLD